MSKIVNSWNEWDPLKRVIVGREHPYHSKIDEWRNDFE